jgi:hypothetical protein
MNNNIETYQLVVARCDMAMLQQLRRAECLLRDLGGSPEEIARAVGPCGYVRQMLAEDRSAQINEAATWLLRGGATLH